MNSKLAECFDGMAQKLNDMGIGLQPAHKEILALRDEIIQRDKEAGYCYEVNSVDEFGRVIDEE